ncbi:hypothetical protein FEK33_08760 [Nocardia asteroides NBRC 15531]|uniref:PPE family domain-containing protein n=1 Tax=Nocardia asteroides NBRC 15531 TaxID=1110697 RepID=U5EP10_NOCAS|nr:hypothetical protein [Nocardia asteroides]TLF70297.1 hypothetical protein FEK33_08760 [Nocardia asteroides NBRC 15531]UGT49825.1 hypothetical protein LT345_04255 [Nocardia asteroides]SFM02178.1 hypothetical protein SAMN05444423_1011776 [Nocardia asteroides]VEG37425.1 Uncharacterised protein [Nocardia asteroides]BAO99000.1 hypothetical protein [Nocardia asteroides NBRC 15531]
MTYEEYKARVIAAQEQWNQERSVIYLTQHLANFSSIFAGETQPNHLTGTDDSYDHMQLAEMQSAVAAMKPSVVNSASEVWKKIGSDLSTTIVAFNKAFEATTTAQNGWAGEAASAAVTAVNNYAKQSSTLPAAATAVSLKLAEMKTGLEQTQALMPGLTERPTLTGKTLPTDGEMKLGDYTETEATDEARRILRTVYGQVAVQSDSGVPFMPTAPKVVGDGGDPQVPGGGGSSQRPSGGGTDETSGADEQTTPETVAGGQSPQDSGGGDDSTTDEGSSTEESATDPSSTEDTTAASTTSPTTTNPTTSQPGTPTGTNPSSPGTTPLGTTPGGGGSPGGRGGTTAGTPTPGRAAPSTPGAANPAAAAARSAGGGTGRAGMSGMPGMGMPGAGRGGQNDDEHRGVPDYLITQENGEILTGIGDVRAVPPVIGGDYGDAQQ